MHTMCTLAKRVRMTLEYWVGAVSPDDGETEPFSESIAKWIGSFVSEPTVRATVMARFRKPTSTWRSRFNLPFKVTMGGEEVGIDGVSLVLPKNPYRALHAFLNTMGEELLVSVDAVRSIEFAGFNIAHELTPLNESLKIFLEQTT
jgi:hypothetical protein